MMIFSGTYDGSIQGTRASLALERSGDRITGTIDAQGYRYQVAGTVSGARATGTLTDPQAGANLPFEATAAGEGVQLVINAEGARLELAFSRAGGAAGVGGPIAAAAAPSAPASAPRPAAATQTGANQRDPRLVGSWSYNENLGDVQTGYGIIEWRLIVRPDGTYTYGNNRSQTNGQWRTQGNVVEVSEDGTSWEPYARFASDGGTMLFTLGDGTKQLWSRR